MAHDDESFYSRSRRIYSDYDPKLGQKLLPVAIELLKATDPISVFEGNVRPIWGMADSGGMFNFFGALASLDDPRAISFADLALQSVEKQLATQLFTCLPEWDRRSLADNLVRFDNSPGRDVIGRAGEAYLAFTITEYTKDIDQSEEPARFMEAKDRAIAHVRWRRELKNRSTSEFIPIEDVAWELSSEGHRLPAFAIALLGLIYRGQGAVPGHYFWTYYISTAHSIDAAAFFLKELQPAQTHDFLLRLLEEARFDATVPPELNNLRYTPYAAKHFRTLAMADPDLASEFPWMLGTDHRSPRSVKQPDLPAAAGDEASDSGTKPLTEHKGIKFKAIWGHDLATVWDDEQRSAINDFVRTFARDDDTEYKRWPDGAALWILGLKPHAHGGDEIVAAIEFVGRSVFVEGESKGTMKDFVGVGTSGPVLETWDEDRAEAILKFAVAYLRERASVPFGLVLCPEAHVPWYERFGFERVRNRLVFETGMSRIDWQGALLVFQCSDEPWPQGTVHLEWGISGRRIRERTHFVGPG